MAIREILIYPDKVLETVVKPVFDTTSDEIKILVKCMADIMDDAPSVGRAAP